MIGLRRDRQKKEDSPLIYAIGDIHGQARMLRALISGLPYREDDTLLFIGDYIDRGEDSKGVIETLLELQEQHKNVVFLRGNHEQMMLEASQDDPDSPTSALLLWLTNGGLTVLQNYGAGELSGWREQIPTEHWDFIRNTQIEYITEAYHFVHAGLPVPGKKWEGETDGLNLKLWIREPFLSSHHNFDNRIVVFGHTPQVSGQPLFEKNKIGIDTGAVFGGPLTAIAIDPSARGRQRLEPTVYQVAPSNGNGIIGSISE
jgi:serine/threonine protein phosphatase 1